jgi:DNA-binding NarL/FixJ family response regulator
VTRQVQILIADHAATRQGIRMALGDGRSICAEAADAEQAIRAAKRLQPDICLVGRDLAGHGLAAIRGICRAAPNAAVVLLADVRGVDDMLDAIRAGAIGYVPGPLGADRLRRVVDAVVAGEAAIPRGLVLELVLELRSGGSGQDALTGRESQVLGMLRRGQSTAAIAKRLQIAPVTVRRHVSELVRKLGVEDRSDLIAAEGSGRGRPMLAATSNGAAGAGRNGAADAS